MASVSDGFIAHCLELLQPVGALRGRRMFSGYGVYADEVFIAILVRETLYLKVDDATRARFESEGGRPFSYEMNGREGRLDFWTVPEDAMESPAQMLPWARLALAAALRARAAKPVAKKKPAKKAAKKVAKKAATKAATKVARKAAKKAAAPAR